MILRTYTYGWNKDDDGNVIEVPQEIKIVKEVFSLALDNDIYTIASKTGLNKVIIMTFNHLTFILPQSPSNESLFYPSYQAIHHLPSLQDSSLLCSMIF